VNRDDAVNLSGMLDAIAGVAHPPTGTPAGAVVLTHGAGGSRESPLLVHLCQRWADRGWLAVRYNLPYRRRRPKGPPSGSATADQDAVDEAIALAHAVMADLTGSGGPVIAGGHSYGGRLTSMAAAGHTTGGALVTGLTLTSYPLHPPGRPERLRTEHFGSITAPTVFTHGSADAFGSIAELNAAAALIPASTEIIEVAGARHDLKSAALDIADLTVSAALRHFSRG